MKYFNYLMNANIINTDQLISQKKIFKPITMPLAVVVTITGVALISSIMPIAFTYDMYRSLKYQYYHNKPHNKTLTKF